MACDQSPYRRERIEKAALLELITLKRLVQTSQRYPSVIDALDACAANLSLPGCDYAYVTEDNRVVGIYEYYDVRPDEPVGKGQRRVLIPKPIEK